MFDVDDFVQLKDYVILKRGNQLVLHQLTKKPRIKYFGSEIDLSNILGNPFWSTYRMELRNKKLYTLEKCDPPDEDFNFALDCADSGEDNRNIQDDNNAQSLSKEEIIGMRDSGISSQDIVRELIKNSKTFSHKTEFAQEKWLRKKSKKHADYILVLKPNIRLLSQVLSGQGFPNAGKIFGIRIDTLSQIITAVNFQSEGKYIIYENNCEGLVIAALLNLTSSKGKLLNVITPNYPFSKRKALNAMKFSDTKKQSLININLSTLVKYSRTKQADKLSPNYEHSSTTKGTLSEVCYDFPTTGFPVESFVQPENHELKRKADLEGSECKRTSYQEKENEEVRELITTKADGLIIVCKEKPNDLVKNMLQFLAPSRYFVVYCTFQEPLVQLYTDFRRRNDVINVKLVENWLRAYQVLPDRTHPEINMSATGGYLLSGMTVTDSDE